MADTQKNTDKPSKYIDEVAVISFYSFCDMPDLEILLPKLLHVAKRKSVRGTIIISQEGFNGSISGAEENLNIMLDELINLTNAPKEEVSIKVNYCNKQPFSKIKVKIKNEIVALKSRDIDVNQKKGEYIETHDWDEFISRDDVVLIDTRNDYEIKIGTFRGAVDPLTDSFRDLPEWAEKNKEFLEGKKIAMCCTGGIRCEKSTAYMKEIGYENVYHLKGGILQYLEDTGNVSGMWKGKCFVFDDRGAVDDDLKPSEGYWVGKSWTLRERHQDKELVS